MKRNSSESDPILTVTELAEYLKVSPATVSRLIKQSALPAFRVGNDWRFNLEQIDRWRVEREKKPST